jgi:hypothetical protein
MSAFCFWILENGTLVKPDARHILAVAAAPAAFGETRESLEQTFVKYGQAVESNFEGKARQEVLFRVIRRNHVRIRKNQQKREQHWSFQLEQLTRERQERISAWAAMITPFVDDRFADVRIYQFHDKSEMRTSLDQLAAAWQGDTRPQWISQDELVRRYGSNTGRGPVRIGKMIGEQAGIGQ